MTKHDDIIYIDEDTYYQIIGEEDKNSYVNFLENNPKFVDVTKPTENKKRKSVYDNNIINKKISMEDQIDLEDKQQKNETQISLEERHQRTEDLRYMPYLIWLEMYLPRHERVFGAFEYSDDQITNKQKCEELLNYYSSTCGITNIEEIYRTRGHRSRAH